MTVPYITHRKFSAAIPQNVRYGFFSRAGGVSTGLYESLNVGLGSQDDPQNVKENRARVARSLSERDDSLYTLLQVHSPDVLVLDCQQLPAERVEADALVTAAQGLVCGVLTADCVPILFAGKKHDGSTIVAGTHSGWGGAYKGVIEQTVAEMRNAGADLSTVAACIGPCIRQNSYEVGDDLREKFLDLDQAYSAAFFRAAEAGKYQFDLVSIVVDKLKNAGIQSVFDVDVDTYPEANGYFSFRRATHRSENDYGRHISAISIAS